MAENRSPFELVLLQQIQAMKNRLAAQELEHQEKLQRQAMKDSAAQDRLRRAIHRAVRARRPG
jgi:hypothetical protein